jgi:glycerol-3-phosphate acyltransferase PlsX
MDVLIAVDAMGGDKAPGAVCEGVKMALEEMADIKVLLFGPAETLNREQFPSYKSDRLTIIDAPEVIEVSEPPMLAVRKKPNSSMVMSMLALRDGRAKAMLTAGSTGALLAGGMTRVGRVRGVERPALATVIPGRNKPFILIDSGANAECRSEYLSQFGLMGSIYAQQVLKIVDPKVALVNIGAEPEKGAQIIKRAHILMKAQGVYHFIGNAEGRELPFGSADVAVADGFTGNVIVKYTEGLSSALMGTLRDECSKGLRAKLGAMLLTPSLMRLKNRMNYEEYGGAPLLGVDGTLIKAHGSSSATAIKNAIRQARAMVTGNVTEIIRNEIERLTPGGWAAN